MAGMFGCGQACMRYGKEGKAMHNRVVESCAKEEPTCTSKQRRHGRSGGALLRAVAGTQAVKSVLLRAHDALRLAP